MSRTDALIQEYERVVLERMQYYSQIPFDGHVFSESINNPNLHVALDNMTYRLMATLVCEVWGQRGQKLEIINPYTWKDGWKEMYYPKLGKLGKWLKKKYPIKYRVVELDAKVIYPGIKVLLHDQPYKMAYNINRDYVKAWDGEYDVKNPNI